MVTWMNDGDKHVVEPAEQYNTLRFYVFLYKVDYFYVMQEMCVPCYNI